ncbi:alkyl sulfatase dimerization domain-containing protein [Dermatobacter hominis]|uniref:alkyl sulfatase dimerization domain-containing protein n=1 Tax=Dermatobacter hominis TaxID=2884263 RepID=UPI001D0FEA82|nr:alkyl sulfatase dimerization domain-containing protein [Dermatobacter hominis]UDY34652.1 MBL fold metallo-hydrolase [Dermatobacter hominis]
MTDDVLSRSARVIAGDLDPGEFGSIGLTDTPELHELADGLAFVAAFSNVAAFTAPGAAGDDELLLVDVSSGFHGRQVHELVRSWSPAPLRTAVYTHGHVDHVGGIRWFEAEAEGSGAPPPEVVAHERVADRFDRYRMTEGYNGVINQRQFRLPGPFFPTDFRYPDRTYRGSTEVAVGDVAVELHHDRGETDDHTWAWVPDRRALCSGDMFIWVSPNCGNPQKVQRYPLEWAAGLRRMADLGAELLLPGHGPAIGGRDDIARVLTTAAEYLESIAGQTLEMMNQGARLDEIVHSVRVPDELASLPWLRPIYDEPEFVVHNLWRLYGGWYDGNPARLKPAPDAALAAELATLAGGPGALAERAGELAADGELRLAGHLAELAAQAAPDDPGVHRVRAAVFGARAREEASLMASGIFLWAAHESERKSTDEQAEGGTT